MAGFTTGLAFTSLIMGYWRSLIINCMMTLYSLSYIDKE
jgi:hypothetical protein